MTLSDSSPATETAQLSQAENDALLQMVVEQLDTLSFDPNDHALLQRLVEGFADTRGMMRLSIAETLGQIGEPATPFLLAALANHPNPVVRRASAKTLTLIADPTAVPTLIHALLHDEDTVVKGSAVGALARTGATAVPPLLAILASPDHPESAKGHAAWALAFIGAEAEEHLYRAINSESVDVRCAVVGAIASLVQEQQNETAFGLLTGALTDEAPAVRAEAAAALGKLTAFAAASDLVPVLQDIDGDVRKTAALALMKLGDRAALDPLRVAANQEADPAIQKVLELAISQLEKRQDDDIW